jgi:hypothetical protein
LNRISLSAVNAAVSPTVSPETKYTACNFADKGKKRVFLGYVKNVGIGCYSKRREATAIADDAGNVGGFSSALLPRLYFPFFKRNDEHHIADERCGQRYVGNDRPQGS